MVEKQTQISKSWAVHTQLNLASKFLTFQELSATRFIERHTSTRFMFDK